MSAADRLEDSFPHGTPEGYERGCRGMRCRGVEDFGWSCTFAVQQFRGDWRWRRWFMEGRTPAEIAVLRAEEPAPVSSRVARGQVAVLPPVVSIADSREPVVERPRRVKAKVAAHGTHSGYTAGCRDAEACPSAVAGGVSCKDAKRQYDREWRARRRESARRGVVASAPVAAAVEAAAEVAEAAKVAPQTVVVGAHEIEVLVRALPDGAVQVSITVPGVA